jgi:peptide/nickel transport system permease protein
VRFLIERSLLVVPTLLGMLVAVFMMLRVAPGDPVELLVDLQVQYVPREQLERIRKDLGLDRPLLEQFLKYAGRVARGDLGYSYRTRSPVMNDIRVNVWPTAHLALAGMAVALVIGVTAGVVSAVKQNTFVDHATLTLAMAGLSAPNFWLGILLLYFLSFRLGWFPIVGDGAGSLRSVLLHLVLPATVVGSGTAALIARLTRSAVLETLGEDYVRTARAKGLPGRVVIIKHVLRNASIPILAATGTMFALLLTGSVVVEIVFARRGLGWLMVGAINNRDFPMVQGLILIFGTIIVLVNATTDLLCGFLDPRASYR